jgi:hypothetical protein
MAKWAASINAQARYLLPFFNDEREARRWLVWIYRRTIFPLQVGVIERRDGIQLAVIRLCVYRLLH